MYYDLITFTVTVETSGNGAASASPASATMGRTVTLTATPAEGSHFVKWEVVSGNIVLNGNTFTMPARDVTVKAVFAEHTYSGWTQNDNDTHTRACTVCGAEQTEACIGGEATCTKEAVCQVCGQPYGEKDPDNHTGQEAWVTTAESHTKVYSCCKAVIQQSEAHTWNDEGRCSVCGYGCTHSGGTATCTQQAVCEICGALYGDPNPGNHTPSEVWTQENGKHYHVCLNGCETHLDEEACTGGTAACTAKAVCQVCGRSYGEKDPGNHTGELVWKQDADSHTQYYDCCGVVTVRQEPHEWEDGKCAECGYGCTHSGGTATCTARAVCEVCGQPYGEKDPDNHTGQEAWVTTAESHMKVYSCCKAVIQQSEAHIWNDEGSCSVCGYGCTHSGGTATCTQQAVCEICGALYGDSDSGNHMPSEVWIQENGKHYHVCLNGCETHLDEEACSGGTAACTAKAVCQVCGQPYGDLDPDNHINLTEVEAVAATQQAEGNTAYWYCEDCGRYFADADALEEISPEDTVIDKLPADTSENGSDGRPENGDNTTAGGTGTAGSSGSQQSGSGTSISGGTSGKDSPKTGDDTAAGLWISFLALSGLGSVSLTILRRRRNR